MTQLHLFSILQARPVRRWLMVVAMTAAIFLLAACDKTGQMVDQPRYDPLAPSNFFTDGRSARSLVANTVPYAAGDTSPNDPALTGLDQNGKPVVGFPQPVTKELVAKGQERYNIYCIPCHGPTGEGNGTATQFGMPKPPNFLGDQVKGLANGDIFNVITNGKGKMFSYGYRVKPDERWAVISYIRAMELKNGKVDPSTLTADELNQLGK